MAHALRRMDSDIDDTDADTDTSELAAAVADELDSEAIAREAVTELDTGTTVGDKILISRRGLGALVAGGLSVGALATLGVDEATAQQAAGQVGTSSSPVDVEAATIIENGQDVVSSPDDDYSAKQTSAASAAEEFIKSSPGDGLANYPDLGDALSVYVTSTDWATNGAYCGAFGNDLSGDDAEGYALLILGGTTAGLFRVDAGANASTLASTSVSLTDSEFYEAIIKRDTDDSSLTAKLYSVDQSNRTRQTELVSLTASDTTYQSADGTVFLGPSSSSGVGSVWDLAYIPNSI